MTRVWNVRFERRDTRRADGGASGRWIPLYDLYLEGYRVEADCAVSAIMRADAAVVPALLEREPEWEYRAVGVSLLVETDD